MHFDSQEAAASVLPRALVIDDDIEYGRLIADVISRQCEVRATTSAEVGARLLGKHRYALLIIEGSLPGISVLELIRAWKRQLPHLRIVVVSRERLAVRQVVEYFEADVDDYFSKPFHPSELAARVGRMVRSMAASHLAQP